MTNLSPSSNAIHPQTHFRTSPKYFPFFTFSIRFPTIPPYTAQPSFNRHSSPGHFAEQTLPTPLPSFLAFFFLFLTLSLPLSLHHPYQRPIQISIYMSSLIPQTAMNISLFHFLPSPYAYPSSIASSTLVY